MILTYKLNDDYTYEPCDVLTWGMQFDTMDRHVAEDEINNLKISTVWLGVNHNYFGGPPLLFETMIFNDQGNDVYIERYTTFVSFGN